MNLVFLPGQLRLAKDSSGDYVVTIEDQEVFRSRVEKKALMRYNVIRQEMESKFPAHELTPEEKRKFLEALIGDMKYTAVRNSMKVPKKDRIAKTRTFG